jgi:hypothetical protein
MSFPSETPLKAFDRATREIARLKDATARRDQAARDLYATGDWTLKALADRSTAKGAPLSLSAVGHIVHGRASRRKP